MSGSADPFFDGTGLRKLFTEVDDELGAGDPIKVVVCGGAAMVFKYNIRRTSDVDVISDPFPEELRRAAAAVGHRNDLVEGWFNDAAKISIPRLAPRLEQVYTGARLEVCSPGPHFLLAMKLAAHRERDLRDAAMLIAEIGFDTVDEAWGHTQQSMAVEYFARKAFEVASGRSLPPAVDPQRFAGGPDGLDLGF